MKLALIIDDYLPHSTRVGAKMFHELALELQNQGHTVTVITPTFHQSEMLVEDQLDGIRVWRFRSGEIKDIDKVKRAINETLLSTKAWIAIKPKVMKDTFDGVVYYSPSIFFGHLVKKIKQRCTCRSYLVLRDLFPQWVIDSGMIKESSPIAKYFRWFEKYLYNQADMIGLMSDKNIEVFTEQYSQYSTQVLRNWAKLTPVLNNQNSYRKQLNLDGKIIFFYGGNIGHAQDMTNLMKLAKGMKEYHNAHFLFVGQGDEVALIERLATEWKLDNYTYLPSISQENFKLLLSEIDIGLFSLAKGHTAHNFPGKLLGYMVESKPILGSVNRGNDLLEMINDNQAGFAFVNGDDSAFLDAAITLYQNQEQRLALGLNAKELLIREFSVEAVAKAIIDEITNRYENY
ncbi:glycosyltransferase family 4 protein [Photobacterium leiognathi]|uniref:glycosyltransferase family 4 protein n=1 Tax=Photobacterium leiognathi TaxID=553611 RepID=UPI0029821B56|nr:glycosyltransferase family 4 protein [Photobacterium leiognathi]